jgi:hypothetical protein
VGGRYAHRLRSQSELRDPQAPAALHDEADRPRYVQTLPGRGYRFIAPVERDAHFISGEDDLVTTAVSHAFVRDQRRIGSRRRSRSRTSVSSRSERARLGTMVRIPSGIDGFYGCKLLNRNGRG